MGDRDVRDYNIEIGVRYVVSKEVIFYRASWTFEVILLVEITY
jgi:hypothetical protein